MAEKTGIEKVKKSGLGISRRATVRWVMLIYFFSGACSLIDEVVWVRLLKLSLGNTVYATSIVVSIFMAGLALGAFIMGRYCDRISKRLRLYALLETLVTISALSLPWALRLADNLYVWFYQIYHPTNTQLLIVQAIISAAIILLPSLLMGSTLPLLGRFITSLEKETGHLVGKLYALNTLGAATGCFLAGFLLIRTLGVMGALYTAAALNLLVAFGGWALSRFSAVAPDQQPAQEPQILSLKKPDGRFYLLILALFLSGLISIGYELLWMRSIIHLLGGFTYVFSAVLTVYLIGNVVGAAIASRISSRLKTPAAAFAVTLFLLGLCGIFYLPVLTLWTSKALPPLKTLGSQMQTLTYTISPLIHSAFLFLAPSVIMGIGFPIALQAWANYTHKVGRSTGAAYSANTIGAVMGGIVTGFVLIPAFGLQLSISILGLAGLWVAAIVWLLFARDSKILGRRAFLAAAALITIVTLKIPLNLFDAVVDKCLQTEQLQLLLVKEGVTTTVSVHKNLDDGSLYMCSSGQGIAGETYYMRGDQKILGHFGVLLNPDAKTVLSVGFGSGETTLCLAQHKLDRIDCVEIAPEVVDVSLAFFRHMNLGDRLYDEINLIFMDAKNYIHLTDTTYDVIVNDSIHPRSFAENASLYAKEYFQAAKEHLNQNGLIASWLPTYDMPASVLKSIIGTSLDVFPHVTLWYLTPHPAPLVLLVGSKQQQYFSLNHIDNELLKEGVRDSLAGINIHSSLDVLSCYIGDENDLTGCITDFSVNSDYSPFVEFTTNTSDPENANFARFVGDINSNSVYKHLDWAGFPPQQKTRWLAAYKRLRKTSTYLFDALASAEVLGKLQHSVDGLSVLPHNTALLNTKKDAEEKLFFDGVKLVVSGRPENALQLADDILKIHPRSATAWMIKSTAMGQNGQMQQALDCSRRAVEAEPENSDAHFNLALTLSATGRFEQAITEFTQTLKLAEKTGKLAPYKKVKTLDLLADTYAAAGKLPEAIEAADKAINIARSTGNIKTAENIAQKRAALVEQITGINSH